MEKERWNIIRVADGIRRAEARLKNERLEMRNGQPKNRNVAVSSLLAPRSAALIIPGQSPAGCKITQGGKQTKSSFGTEREVGF